MIEVINYPHKNKYIKVLILISILLLIVLISVLLYITLINPTDRISKAEKFGNKTEKFIIEKGGDSNSNEAINKINSLLNNPRVSAKEKYDALAKLSFYFSSAYSSSHDPSIRAYSSDVIGKYAKENFPNLYHKYEFDIPCSDPICGQKLSPEIVNVINKLKNSKVDPEIIKMIIGNLTSAGHIPDNSVDDKKTGFSISYRQMIEEGDPEASKAAELLKSYAKSKYKIDL